MSVDHNKRITGVIKSALEQSSFKEPYGYAVDGPSMAPQRSPDGQVAGVIVYWSVLVSIRDGLGPQIAKFDAIPGALPPDDQFRKLALALLEACRQERDQKQAETMKQAKKALSESVNRKTG